MDRGQGKLYLLPHLIDKDADVGLMLPKDLASVVDEIEGLICESRKEGIRYLIRFIEREKANALPIYLLNEHSKKEDLLEIFQVLNDEKKCLGLISDAGLACIADPGALLVKMANKHNIPVKTYPGPSSLIMALQLSGFSGQKFSFHGYLPKEETELRKKIKTLEKAAESEGSTEIWIEAPYRTDKMLQLLLSLLKESTHLCVASSLTSKEQKVISMPVADWKGKKTLFGKVPAVFLLSSGK